MSTDELIGTTETGDISFDLSAFDRLHAANIIITKRLTDKVIDGLVAHREQCILHLTVTGWGGTPVEPLAPTPQWSRRQLDRLLAAGFPAGQVVLRIDPIILTEEGMVRVSDVLCLFEDSGITRVRASFLDMYRHVRERFLTAGIRIPHETFHAPLALRKRILAELTEEAEDNGITVEVCGEPGLPSTPCVSQKDIDILGLTGLITLKGSARQRDACGCPANKKQILTKKPGRCANSCAYCYWRDDADQQ